MNRGNLNDLEDRYRMWRATHEPVYNLFRRFALVLLQQRRRFGFRLIAERVRWEMLTTQDPTVAYKVNDHYTPYIARDLIAEYPELGQWVETRPVRGEVLDAGARRFAASLARLRDR